MVSFLVFWIFKEDKVLENLVQKRACKKRQKQDLLNKVLSLIDLVVHVSLTSEYCWNHHTLFEKICQDLDRKSSILKDQKQVHKA